MRKNPKFLTRMKLMSVIFVLFMGIVGFSAAQVKKPVAWWAFDIQKKEAVPERVSGLDDSLSGNFRYYKGVSGRAL